MSVVSLSAARVVPESELEQIVQLAVTLSGRMARLRLDNIGAAIAETLGQVARATRIDGCQLIEFTAAGSVARTHLPVGGEATADARRSAPLQGAWLVGRLSRGEAVSISRPDELPRDAENVREAAGREGICSMLGVPAFVAGQVVCALVLDTAVPRRWPQPLIERLQLLSAILGAALQRDRDENTLRANVTMIERLNARLAADNVYLKEEIKNRHDFDDIVGESAALRLALARVSQVAPTNSNVLLLGPTGTGKELFARAVHERSRRHERPLVRVNCAALPPTLVESELFGHEKGAFTGAISARQGRFELADGGTIFLDEIGDLAPEVQVKFLRVLQEGEFERVGSSRSRRVDVRVIAATHQDLETAVAEGRFRSDLYYRLCVYPIRLPSLRERPDDIPRLVWFFINRGQRELGRQITKVPQSVMDALQRHAWPGNVRELENVVERAMISSSGDTLHLDEPSPARPDALTGASRAAASDNLDRVQCAHIEAVLERCGWRINGSGNAAERLGVHPNTLRFRMKKLGVVCREGRGRPSHAH
jgi:formate hydrogenlyase transcriptional activator